MDDKERLMALMARLGMNPNSFARSLGLKRADKIYAITNDRNGISKYFAAQIVATHKTVRLQWLLSGEGEMMTQDQPGGAVDYHHAEANEGEVPYGSTGTMSMRGDYMEPTYRHGDRLEYRMVNKEGIIEHGRAFIVETANGKMVRRVLANGPGNVILKADNKKYPDLQVSLDDIVSLAIIDSMVRME